MKHGIPSLECPSLETELVSMLFELQYNAEICEIFARSAYFRPATKLSNFNHSPHCMSKLGRDAPKFLIEFWIAQLCFPLYRISFVLHSEGTWFFYGLLCLHGTLWRLLFPSRTNILILESLRKNQSIFARLTTLTFHHKMFEVNLFYYWVYFSELPSL